MLVVFLAFTNFVSQKHRHAEHYQVEAQSPSVAESEDSAAAAPPVGAAIGDRPAAAAAVGDRPAVAAIGDRPVAVAAVGDRPAAGAVGAQPPATGDRPATVAAAAVDRPAVGAVGAQPPAVGAELAVGAAGRSVRVRHAAAEDRPATAAAAAVDRPAVRAVGAQPPAVGAEPAVEAEPAAEARPVAAVGVGGRPIPAAAVEPAESAAAAADGPSAVEAAVGVEGRPIPAAAVEPAEPAAAGPSAEDPGRSDFEDFHTFFDQAGPGDQVHRQTFMKAAILQVQQTIDRMHTMKCVQCHRGEIVEKAVRPTDETHLCAFCKRDRNCEIPFYSYANHTVGPDFTLFVHVIP